MRADVKTRLGPNGIHVLDRCTGLNLLIDEVTVPEHLWHKAPRQVSIALTNACDLRCSYCYAPKEGARLNGQKIMSWLDELEANGCLGIGFGGGEPTLHTEVQAICAYAVTLTSMAVSLTTHGHWTSPSIVKNLAGKVHFIRVSVDGVASTYERLRGRKFSTLRTNLCDISAISRFGLNMVVNGQTVDELDAVANFAHEVGARELLLLPERPTARTAGIDDESRAKLVAWSNGGHAKIALSIAESDSAGMSTFNPLLQEKGLRSYAHIDAFGIVKRSSFDGSGVPISHRGVLAAIAELESFELEKPQ